MSLDTLNRRPRLAVVPQLALLVMVFHGVIATTPAVPVESESTLAGWSRYVPLVQPQG